MHVGHCRGAILGDVISNVLTFNKHKVIKEYYVNDAGRQIDILACSIFLRKFECFEENTFPSSAYKGSYILEIAQDIEADLAVTESQKATLIDSLPEDGEEKILHSHNGKTYDL